MVGHAGTIGGGRQTGELLDALISLAELVKDDKALKALKKATEDNLKSAERAGVGTSLNEARNTAKKILEDAKAKRAEADTYFEAKKAEIAALQKEQDRDYRDKRKVLRDSEADVKRRETTVAGLEADLKKAQTALSKDLNTLAEDRAALETRRHELEAWAGRLRQAATPGLKV